MARQFSSAGSAQTLGTASGTHPFGSAFSLSAWVYPNDSATGIFEGIICHNVSSSASYFGLSLSNGFVRASIRDASVTHPCSATGTYTSGQWTHVGFTTDRSTNHSTYRDGGNKGTITDFHPFDGPYSDLLIGGEGTYWSKLNARVAEVAVWSILITEVEMAALGAGVSPLLIRPDSLWAYWPLTGNESPELDRWKNRYDLTLTNGPTKTDHYPIILPYGAAVGYPFVTPTVSEEYKMFLVF